MMWSNIQSINIEMSKPPKPKHPEAPEAGEELMYVDFQEKNLRTFTKRRGMIYNGRSISSIT